ncbi:MAG: DNA repair protein RecN [Sporanaerobacter sp.]|jgi:DNA repair protein RecN (Recombination protein N)|uniref:DNA repair protein RecN n=1 Tax=Sporanaerobacter sp. TaxID=2010183 RepID=UPI003A100A6E
MLVELNIENFAVAEKLHINFSKGFNVLTGETGAGKSVIVDAIGMILGGRANKDLIRTGCDKAILEGLFYLEKPIEINKILDEYGIENEKNDYLLITREVYSTGRSISRINGRTVTLGMLNNVTKYLIDIHGQHEHQSLLNSENHIHIIDSFGDSNFRSLKEDIYIYYNELVFQRKKLKDLSMDEIEKDREIDLLKYQIEEIDSAKLSKEEEEEIAREYNKLSNIKEIESNISEALNILQSKEYEGFSIIDAINRVISLIGGIKNLDIEIKKYYESFTSIGFELQDLSGDLRYYLDNITVDEERLAFLEERLDTINKLKKKYGNNIDEIITYRNEIYERFQILLNNEKEISHIRNEIEKIEKLLEAKCEELSNKRKEIASILEESLSEELKELNMSNVLFKVSFKKYSHFTPEGFDNLEFLISTNPGEDLKPLSKIVSGGEMSRIMLAFKSILAEYDKIPCLIFDEIDTGISGRTAQVVGEKIANISKKHQIICVSHLPQIAALADTHFSIYKNICGSRTVTQIKKLSFEERIEELSRLLGGVDLTDTTKMHAKEMLNLAVKIKNR